MTSLEVFVVEQSAVGNGVGRYVGFIEMLGVDVGANEGEIVGFAEGKSDGVMLGSGVVGEKVGLSVGTEEGAKVGTSVVGV